MFSLSFNLINRRVFPQHGNLQYWKCSYISLHGKVLLIADVASALSITQEYINPFFYPKTENQTDGNISSLRNKKFPSVWFPHKMKSTITHKGG